jgi:DNA gyrase subunit A
MGVIGMTLTGDDQVVGMQLNTQGQYLLFVSENGMGKRTDMEEFTVQRRGGKGVKCYKITEKTGNVIGVKAVNEENEVMLITTEGIIIRLMVNDISLLGRITSGVKLIDMDDDITVANFTKVRESNTTTTEEVIKILEKELDEENSNEIGHVPDEDYEDYEIEEDELILGEDNLEEEYPDDENLEAENQEE